MEHFRLISRRSISYKNTSNARRSIIGNIVSKRNIWKFCVNTKWNMMKGIYGHSEAASPFQGLIPLRLIPGLTPWALLRRPFRARTAWIVAHNFTALSALELLGFTRILGHDG